MFLFTEVAAAVLNHCSSNENLLVINEQSKRPSWEFLEDYYQEISPM